MVRVGTLLTHYHSLLISCSGLRMDADDANYGLKVNGFKAGLMYHVQQSRITFIGHSMDLDSEIVIPWNCIGSPSTSVRMIGIVQDESTGAVNSVHPAQNIATGAVGQTFNDEMTALLGHSDLDTGSGPCQSPSDLQKLHWFKHSN